MTRTESIRQTLVTAYWLNPRPGYMASKAVTSLNITARAELEKLESIITRHLLNIDFIAMAEDVAAALGESHE